LTNNKESHERELALLNSLSEILASYVTHHDVEPEKLPTLISSARMALLGQELDSSPVLAKENTDKVEQVTLDNHEDVKENNKARTPAVAIEHSVSDDEVFCLECGKAMKTLRRHLHSAHQLDEETYKERWGLAKEHLLVAPSYSRRRKQVAKDIGLGVVRKQ